MHTPRHIWMWGKSSSWHPKPAFSMFNTYSCHWRLPLCVLTHLLLVSHPLPPLPFLYWLSFLPEAWMKLKQVTGHSSNLLSSFPFFAFSYSISRLPTAITQISHVVWLTKAGKMETTDVTAKRCKITMPTFVSTTASAATTMSFYWISRLKEQ